VKQEGRTTIEMVAEFHETFGHPIADKVGEETLSVRQLRIKLLFEELKELAEASDCKLTFAKLRVEGFNDPRKVMETAQLEDGNNVDHVEELDALCDIQVVLDGKKLTSGHHKHFDEAFKEVHRSNMSKGLVWEPESDDDVVALAQIDVEHGKKLIESGKAKSVKHVHREVNGIQIVSYIREDGKLLKGPDFSEPDLKPYVKV